MLKRRGDQAQVESKTLEPESAACLRASSRSVECNRPDAVTELLPDKRLEGEFVAVSDDGSRRPCAEHPMVGPSRSEFAVLVRKAK